MRLLSNNIGKKNKIRSFFYLCKLHNVLKIRKPSESKLYHHVQIKMIIVFKYHQSECKIILNIDLKS